MQEALLYAIWQNLARSRQEINTGSFKLRVLEAGQLNLQRGPDFTAALFELNGTRFKGDVEMHRHINDWYTHHHHLDPFFKNVCLHIVLSPPLGPNATVTSVFSQNPIPSLQLDVQMFSKTYQKLSVHCHPPKPLKSKALIDLSLNRLHLKIRQFQHRLGQLSFQHVFYQSFFRALGYPHNSNTFELLAQRLPWNWLTLNWSLAWHDFDFLYALYAGGAGFLPIFSKHPYVQRLMNYFQDIKPLLPFSPLNESYWQFAGVRAHNHPHYRLASWIALITKYRSLPLQPLRELFEARLPYEQLFNQLKQFFYVHPIGYWKNHHHLRQTEPCRKLNQNYLGTARLLELILNLFIPLFASQALLNKSTGYFEYLQGFYLYLPLHSIYYKVQKKFPWWSIYEQVFPKQALMQALLHLDEQFCRVKHCHLCPLKHIIDNEKDFH